MKAKWEKVIAAHMETLDVPGRDTPLYKPKRQGGFVWVVAGGGEFPAPPPTIDRQDVLPRGGRELELDVSDDDFLRVRKVIGMTEYTHCIPWASVVDIVFVNSIAD
jgi:hypothetical protein